MKPILVVGLFAAALGSAAPTLASKVVMRDVTCPIDGRKFKARVQLSAYVTGRRLDLRPVGRVAAPSPLPVCPGSGFPVFEEKFDAAQLGKIRKILNTAEYRKVRKAHPSYYVAAFLKERLGYGASEVAMDVLRAAWQAENGEKSADFYLNEALRRFDELARSAKPSEKSRATALFLTVELSRRLGRFEDAGARLDRFEAAVGQNNVEFRPALLRQERELIAKRDSTPQVQQSGDETEDGRKED
jgi:uncharacterized protein (DUF2225 family)